MEQFEERQEIKLSDYLLVLFRRRHVILITFTIIFVITAVKTMLTKPVYEARSTIQLEERTRESQLLTELVIMSRWNPVNTEMEILKSRTISEEVVRKLGLDRVITSSPKDLNVQFGTIQTDSMQDEKVFTIRFTDSDGNYIVLDGEKPEIGHGRVGELFKIKPLNFKIDYTNATKGDSVDIILKPFNKVVESIQNSLKVEDVGNQTNIILIKFRYRDPVLARDILNKLIEVYLNHNVARKSQDISQALEFIEGQLNIVRDELEKSETALDRYKSEHGFVELSAETSSLIDKISEFERARTELLLKKKQIEPLYNSLKSNGGLGGEYILPSITTEDPVVTNLVSNLTQLEVQKRTLLEEFTEIHPQVVIISTQINELKKKIINTLENTINAINQREKALNLVINRYEDNLKNIPKAERELANLMRSSRVNEDIYTFLLKKHEETRIAKAATVSNIHVIDPAILPETPVEPKRKRNLIIGILVGILTGVTFAFVMELLDDSIKSVEEIERKLKLSVYGSIPHFPEELIESPQPTEKQRRSRRRPRLFTQLDPRSSIAEAYRSLRTNIQFAELEKPMRSILITSAGPAEGKTTSAVNLAIAFAQTGVKTALMDCDLRKPAIHNYFNIPQEPGVSNYLLGKAGLDEVLHSSGQENLSLIPCGAISPNPAELLSTPKMNMFLSELKGKFDFLIIDSPPVLAVTDAVILSSRSDAIFMVIQSGRATKEGVSRARISLDNVRAPLKGAIINDLRPESFMKYGYYRYYYRYPYYYYYHSYSSSSEGKTLITALSERIKSRLRIFRKE